MAQNGTPVTGYGTIRQPSLNRFESSTGSPSVPFAGRTHRVLPPHPGELRGLNSTVNRLRFFVLDRFLLARPALVAALLRLPERALLPEPDHASRQARASRSAGPAGSVQHGGARPVPAQREGAGVDARGDVHPGRFDAQGEGGDRGTVWPRVQRLDGELDGWGRTSYEPTLQVPGGSFSLIWSVWGRNSAVPSGIGVPLSSFPAISVPHSFFALGFMPCFRLPVPCCLGFPGVRGPASYRRPRGRGGRIITISGCTRFKQRPFYIRSRTTKRFIPGFVVSVRCA